MKSPTLKDKIAYYARVRRANYANSLRLEGFEVKSQEHRKNPSLSVANKKAAAAACVTRNKFVIENDS